jgi:hypothetical protein
MTSRTPDMGITYPDAGTKLADLSAVLRQMALDIENALEGGATPTPVDTGWLTVDLSSAFTTGTGANRLSARIFNGFFALRGTVIKSSGGVAGGDVIGTVPLAGRPSLPVQQLLAATSGITARLQIGTDGQITVAATPPTTLGSGAIAAGAIPAS